MGAETECRTASSFRLEAISGGEAMNAGRKKRGCRPLALLVVGLVGSSSEEEEGEKGDGVEGKISLLIFFFLTKKLKKLS